MTVVFRHAAYDTPWWVIANRQDGRFHRGGETPTQYWCCHPLGPAAELLRHQLGRDGAADADTVRLNLWAADVDTDDLVRLDFVDCAAHGLGPDELVGDDHRATQAAADRLRADGADGLVFHSASLPGTLNVVLFGARLLHPFSWTPTIPEEIRTGHITDGARPAAEVVPFVRWLGDDHSALDEWTANGAYTVFEDPVARRW